MTRNHIDLVGKTIKVLEVLDEASAPLNMIEIANRSGLVKSTAFRILFSLKELGYVDQRDSRGNYGLTVKMARLGRNLLNIRTLKKVALPHMERVWAAVDETVALGILENGQPIMAEILESRKHVRVVLSMAAVCYFHASSLGKAMAAYLPSELVEQTAYLQGMPQLTEETNTNKKRLHRELEQVRKRGYAMNKEESHHGAIYIATPIFRGNGKVAGAMNVGLPTTRYSEAKKDEIVNLLKQACFRLSEELGCSASSLRSLMGMESEPPLDHDQRDTESFFRNGASG
jgi:DNA-binding IclR family transcriptional regulator